MPPLHTPTRTVAVFGLLVTVGCDAQVDSDFVGTGQVQLDGVAQKGPFVTGSTVTVGVRDASGAPTGDVYLASTTDDLGTFSVALDHLGPVTLEASGFSWNEATGTLSGSPMTLRAWHVVGTSGTQTATVNLLTHLAAPRVEALILGGVDPSVAIEQADEEVLLALDLADPSFDPGAPARELSLSGGSTDGNDFLFAASAIVAHAGWLRGGNDGADGATQELANLMALDLADGTLSTEYTDELALAEGDFDPWKVTRTFQARLDRLGSGQTAPNLQRFVDSDQDGVANDVDTCALQANPTQSSVPDGACVASWTVSEAESIDPRWGFLQEVAVGDLDGDGRDDVVVSDGWGAHTFLADTDGMLEWTARTELPVGLGKGAIGDVTGDGVADWVGIPPYPDDEYRAGIGVATGDGGGGFSGFSELVVGYLRGLPNHEPILADFDGDGVLDAAYGYCVVYFDGTGGIASVDHCTWEAENAAAVGDFNEDGEPDIVTVGTSWYVESYVRLSDGAGGFVDVVVGDVLDRDAAVADVDGDGHLDLVLSGGDRVRVALGDGAGGFSVTTLPEAVCSYVSVHAAQVNGGGDMELLCGDSIGASIQVLDLAGELRNRIEVPVSALDIAVGDTDADGSPDVISIDFGEPGLDPGTQDGVGVVRLAFVP